MSGLLLSKISSLGLLLALGWLLGRLGLLKEETRGGLAKLLLDVTIPAMIVSGLLGMGPAFFRSDPWPAMLGGVAVGLGGLALAWLPARVFARDPSRRGTFLFLSSMGNSSFLPLPLSQSLWGGAGVLTCLAYVAGNNFVLFTLGIGLLSSSGRQGPPLARDFLRTLFHPQTLSFLAAGAMLGLGLSLPGWVMEPLGMLGNATFPLAMVTVGAVLSDVRLDRGLDWRFQSGVAALKLLLLPGLALLVLKLLPLPRLASQLILLEAAMPSLASASLYARRFGGDEKQAAAASLITTLLCPLLLAFWMGLL